MSMDDDRAAEPAAEVALADLLQQMADRVGETNDYDVDEGIARLTDWIHRRRAVAAKAAEYAVSSGSSANADVMAVLAEEVRAVVEVLDVPADRAPNVPSARSVGGEHGGDAFADFFKREYQQVVALVMRAGATLEEAEEIADEAMALTAARFHGLSSPDAWVRVVALRLNARRAAGARPSRKAEGQAGNPAGDEDAFLRRVREVIADLPSAQQMTLALTVSGYTPSEIADLLGITRATAYNNLRRARHALAAALRQGERDV